MIKTKPKKKDTIYDRYEKTQFQITQNETLYVLYEFMKAQRIKGTRGTMRVELGEL